jgi:hypothetical protein
MDEGERSLPARIFLGWPREKGDSGALVTDLKGRGIGMYPGGIVNTATSRMEGISQHLGQAAGILNCELFQ